ncbi:class I SAM-dependent methyltransferase [Saccharothrix variisporea]|uniref:Ubiquinone/menaquinone biosynthesis C-methylase UbiE n=1 Tax=Saccharothrix variisporea TaxID=543527 RepID=A0A495X3A3_9PSEU|nr:class I SAM-dependent methyltransferase [Saccharothrix variisporea]RKT68029.1 ubiquinone/menaquinone biosynthesis C-methylase UbiE [Saccharothrix variisporea]
MTIIDALRALTEGERERAAELAAGSRGEVGRALATYLTSEADGSVYDRPAAFTAFIDGGGNVGLYQAVARGLAGLYDAERPGTLLDVGCGDGRALVPSLEKARHRPRRVTLVEPSAALLAGAVERLRDVEGVTVDARNVRVEEFLREAAQRIDLVQSTFALHALPHDERDAALAALASRVGKLALVEFDVPDLDGDERLAFLAETYERGLAEYGADRDLVAQGFLMPVLTGQLLPGAKRSTWEQPATAWAAQLRRAGFTDVRLEPLFDYWSSPAFLLTASGSRLT